MHKKLAATLTIAIFLISTLAIIVPAQATFTLGALSGTSRYHLNDYDPHVAGPVGYVWPGSGQAAYSGALNFASPTQAPGYQSPYPGNNPPGAPSTSWYQLEGDTYAPFGAVLTNSTGDLIFGLNATCTPDLWNKAVACANENKNVQLGTPAAAEIQTPLTRDGGWDTWMILIPPEFTVPGAASFDSSQISSTLTNSYDRYFVAKLSPYDRYAPNWTLVAITVDAGSTPGYNDQYIVFNHVDPVTGHQGNNWYYARINGVTAPSVAGRYFFKMMLYSSSNKYGVGPTLGGGSSVFSNMVENPDVWVPPQNWPVLLVKGEIDPAIITGTLRYAGYNQTLYGQPIGEAGQVWAKMTMRIDPYTGLNRPDLPTIDAQAYVNATANGHYELEGLAPGVYDIYGEAAGFPQTLIATGVTVLKGQSLHFDGYLQPGPVIHGNVFSKHQFGDEPWPLSCDPSYGRVDGGDVILPVQDPNACVPPGGMLAAGNPATFNWGQYMKIELYANPTLSNIVDPSAGPAVSWSPLPCVAGGQEQYYGRRDAAQCGDPHNGAAVAFPWHEYSTINPAAYNDPAPFFPGNGKHNPNGYSRDVSISACFGGTSCTTGKPLLASDPEGVGPPQQWVVQGGTTTPFHFEFGVKGEYGAPRDLSGEVPQVYATWINGLTPGRYYVRAWTFRYVQTALDGATFQEYYFDVTPNEWAGDVTLPLDLRLSSWVNKTVYFHNTMNTITTDPVTTGAGYIQGDLTGADGHIYAYNVTNLGYRDLYYGCAYDQQGQSFASNNFGFFTTYTSPSSGITYTGSGEYGAPSGACPGLTNFINRAHYNRDSIASGRAVFQLWGINDTWGGENYGIPSGTYTVDATVEGYRELSPGQQVSVTLSGTPSSISDHLIRGPGFNVSVYSIDWERPRVSRPWVWGEDMGGEHCTKVNGKGVCTAPPLAAKGYGFVANGFANGYNPIGAGSEIDIGFYTVTNGTAGALADYFGVEPTYMPPAVPTGPNLNPGAFNPGNLPSLDSQFNGLFQGYGGIPCPGEDAINYGPTGKPNVGVHDAFGNEILGNPQGTATPVLEQTCRQMDGGGRNVLGGQSFLHGQPLPTAFSENAHFAYFGQAGRYLLQGGYTSGSFGFLRATKLLRDSMFTSPITVRALTFADGTYNLRAYTYGYVQDKDFTAYAQATQVSDMKINLVIGVNVTLDVLFKKESIITPTNGNMSARVRLFDDSGQLVSEWMSSEGTYVPKSGFAVAANGAAIDNSVQYPFLDQGQSSAPQAGEGRNEGYNYLPGGTTELHVLMAGLPQQPPVGTDITGVYFGDPIQGGSCDFELDCFPGAYAQYPFANTGILGAPDYTGGWTAEVDFVPWYANNTYSSVCNIAGSGTPKITTTECANGFVVTPPYPVANYYPPVNGLLMGESYHIIPGTTATSGISLTEDMALNSNFVGHSLAANHLGPYSQEGVWQIAGTHNSGEASAIFEVDLNGFISGNVLAFTWSNEFRTLSWGTVSVTGASGATWPFYTYDGVYQAYLPPGTYSFTISTPGYAPQTWSVAISPGQSGTGQNLYLEQSNIPVPEFSGVAVVAFSALAASVYLLRRRRN